ncbi:hypothetical protein BELL_0005g00220 [Botrytis elliptica]|uniref:Dockerin type 1 n=1 Tax=Botrytis elliptica TaxID=278938 RepID=A0A4Z1K358_9HELO|nr:hypothetical protein EAE99_006828 [Botrytis elliptica]TGO80539.1 hypothetical protein BELL_0005g00220 [Botrytis elliptica]
MGLPNPSISILGPDPQRTHRINANSFQQNAITTFNGWQYVAFYTDHPTSTKLNACMMNLGRRKVSPTHSKWDILSFHDYEQVVDDGHNTISIGICSGDGSIHIAFDHHCDRLRFKILKRIDSEKHPEDSNVWNASLFSQTQDYLPGIAHNELMDEVTYPRFVNVDDDLLLTYRIGQAGLGSDILYRYSGKSSTYTYLGQHLTGVSNSPYINGLDYQNSRLYLSWCYRNFILFESSTGTDAHKQQAGPNGPENNYDLNFAYSEDVGKTWKSSDGTILAVLDGKEENTILPQSKARVFEIPMGSGILNQEAQAADRKGGFWVLNRENSAGEQQWIIYYRDCTGGWTKNAVPTDGINKPTEIGSRGSISVDSKNNVYLALPGNTDSTLSIVKVHSKDGQVFFDLVWSASGFDGEPSVEIQEVEGGENLSIFTRTDKKEDGLRDVVVLDFDLDSKPI